MFKAQSNIYDGGFFANIGKPLTIFTKSIINVWQRLEYALAF